MQSESNINGLLTHRVRDIQQAEARPAAGLQIAGQDNAVVKPGNTGWAILKQHMVNKVPKKEVFTVVLMSVAKAFIDTGTKEISEADRNYLVNELTDNIVKHYPGIRLNEIPEAIWQGVRGRFGEFYGLSLVSFERFIEQYLFSERRTQMVKELPAEDTIKPAPNLQIQFETGKYNAIQALQRKKDGKDISTTATSVYNFLDRLQLFAFTTNEKYDMMADATRELIDELKFKLIIARSIERTGIKQDIEAYKKAITEHAAVNTRLANLTKMRAKKLALDAFLKNVLLEGKNLEEMMEDRKAIFVGRC